MSWVGGERTEAPGSDLRSTIHSHGGLGVRHWGPGFNISCHMMVAREQ
jgi:hypothetical protein